MTYSSVLNRNAAMKRWYARNRIQHIALVRKRKQEMRAWMRGYKAMKGCEKCGETDPEALDFHHRDEKEKSFSLHNCANTHGFEQIKKEVAKCDVYCSNCHRKFHKHWRNRGRVTATSSAPVAA